MASGGNPNNYPDIDFKTFWPESDVNFMENMLRATGKFHIIPKYEEEEDSDESSYTLSGQPGGIRATSTPNVNTVPKSFSRETPPIRPVPPPVPKQHVRFMDQQPASIQSSERSDPHDQSNGFNALAQNAALRRASFTAADSSMDITRGQGHIVPQRQFQPELPFHSSRHELQPPPYHTSGQPLPPPHSEVVASYERFPTTQQSLNHIAKQQYQTQQQAGFQPKVSQPPPPPTNSFDRGHRKGSQSDLYQSLPPIPSTNNYDSGQRENTIKKEIMLPAQQQEQQSRGYGHLIVPEQAQHNVVQNRPPHNATYPGNQANLPQFAHNSNQDYVTNPPSLRNPGPSQQVFKQEPMYNPNSISGQNYVTHPPSLEWNNFCPTDGQTGVPLCK